MSTTTSPPVDRTELRRFLAAFGSDGGVWYAAGKTFSECRDLHARSLVDKIAAMTAERDAAKSRVRGLESRIASLQNDCARLTAVADQRRAHLTRLNALGVNMDRFAAGLLMPPRSMADVAARP
jgi:hypothetical protein